MAVACACAACDGTGAEHPEPAERSRSAITNGSADTGDDAVVAIVLASGATECSGTLVAPHVVLTAAHCTEQAITDVKLGTGSTATASTVRIASAIVAPQFAHTGTVLENDVALLVLASAVPVEPMPLGTTAPDVGTTVTLVGWGETGQDAGDTGQKRRGTGTVTALAPATFDVGPAPSQPCDGDSGGPALAISSGVQSVVGVTSHGDGSCARGATYVRVDAVLDTFVRPAMAAVADGTAAPGARCLFPEQCAGGAAACVTAPDDSSLTYCTTSCLRNADCPAGMACVDVGGASQCRYAVPTPGAYGAACGSDADCAEGQCTTTGVCALRCDPTAPACLDGFACTNTADIDFYCLAAPPAVGGGTCALSPAGSSPALAWMAASGALGLRVARRRLRRR